MIWSKKHLVGPGMAHDVVGPKMLELETAKGILSELFDIRINEVSEMIRTRLEERMGYCQEFKLSYETAAITAEN